MDDIRLQRFSPERRDLTSEGIGPYPLEGRVAKLLKRPRPAAWRETGFTRSDYLGLVEPLVRMGASWVDGKGALIDPVVGREWGQSSPRFVSAAAVLHFGRIPEHRDTVFRAMSYCCERLATFANRHGVYQALVLESAVDKARDKVSVPATPHAARPVGPCAVRDVPRHRCRVRPGASRWGRTPACRDARGAGRSRTAATSARGSSRASPRRLTAAIPCYLMVMSVPLGDSCPRTTVPSVA